MPQNALQQIISDAPKNSVLVGGLSTPAIANNPGLIDWHWLTVNYFLNITYDVWIMLISLAVALHTLGLFRGIRWLYRKATGYKSAEA